MNALSIIKRKMKNAVVPIIAGGGIVFVTASNALAVVPTPMNIQPIVDAIAGAIVDIIAAGLVLIGAYAAVWGVKQVKILFVNG